MIAIYQTFALYKIINILNKIAVFQKKLTSGFRDAHTKIRTIVTHFLKSVFFACISPGQQGLSRVKGGFVRWAHVQDKCI